MSAPQETQVPRINRLIVAILIITTTLLGCHIPFVGTATRQSPPLSYPSELPQRDQLAALRGELPASKHEGVVLDVARISSMPVGVLSFGSDGAIIRWDVKSGSGRLIKKVPSTPSVGAFAAKAAVVAYATGNIVTVTCITQCTNDWNLTKLKSPVSSLAFHQNDETLLIGGSDGRVYRWRYLAEPFAESNQEKEKILERYLGHQTIVSSVAALPVGRAFFSADWSGTLMGWLPYGADDFGGKYDRNLQSGGFFGGATSAMRAARPMDRGISTIATSDDGSRLIIGTEDGSLEVWNVRGFTMAAQYTAHQGRVLSVSPNSDGTVIASVGRDSVVNVVRLERNPLYLVGQKALPQSLAPISTQRVNDVKRAILLPSGDVLIATATGALGELRVDYSQSATSVSTEAGDTPSSQPSHAAPPTMRERTEKDSDY